MSSTLSADAKPFTPSTNTWVVFSSDPIDQLRSDFNVLIGDAYYMLRPDYSYDAERKRYRETNRTIFFAEFETVVRLQNEGYKIEAFRFHKESDPHFSRVLSLKIPGGMEWNIFHRYIVNRLDMMKKFGLIHDYVSSVPLISRRGNGVPVGYVKVVVHEKTSDRSVLLAKHLLSKNVLSVSSQKGSYRWFTTVDFYHPKKK